MANALDYHALICLCIGLIIIAAAFAILYFAEVRAHQRTAKRLGDTEKQSQWWQGAATESADARARLDPKRAVLSKERVWN